MHMRPSRDLVARRLPGRKRMQSSDSMCLTAPSSSSSCMHKHGKTYRHCTACRHGTACLLFAACAMHHMHRPVCHSALYQQLLHASMATQAGIALHVKLALHAFCQHAWPCITCTGQRVTGPSIGSSCMREQASQALCLHALARHRMRRTVSQVCSAQKHRRWKSPRPAGACQRTLCRAQAGARCAELPSCPQ